MRADCHMHMVLDGVYWKAAIERHENAPEETFIRNTLARYRDLGYTYLRDCGDRWGVGRRARELAPMYGITYRTPLAPLCMAGHYGSFIGRVYRDLKEYTQLIRLQKQQGADFIKIMISGLMDFHQAGVLTEPGLDRETIDQLIQIAHQEGMGVSAHANGAETVLAAVEAGVDSVEHGAYLNDEALSAMEEMDTIWVPTLSTVGTLRGKGRFPDAAVRTILDSAQQNLSRYKGLVAVGTDAGAWQVPHGSDTEQALLLEAGITEYRMEAGNRAVMEKF